MTTLLLIPKSVSIYTTFVKSKIPFKMSYVITPYTKTKAADSGKLFRDTFFGVEREVDEIEQVPRSIFSRFVWSLIILVIGLGCSYLKVYGIADFGVTDFDQPPMTGAPLSLGHNLWFEFSVVNTWCAVMLAISTFIIKEYLRLFISITRQIILLFKQI